jgi:hypothetical protein
LPRTRRASASAKRDFHDPEGLTVADSSGGRNA